ncbi:MAG: alpha-galactosidase [Erysipelotrichaceae bacterium]|nr:alpha-galactosidase [Erysipelotrichaceae bacterium]
MENRKIQWKVNDIHGESQLQEINLIQVDFKGTLNDVSAVIKVSPTKKMFFNGYQSWTYCPEYTVKDRIRGLVHTPAFGIKKFGLDRYADYHFVNYDNKRGHFHGFSYCYFRNEKKYQLFASLDEYPGYTIFYYDSRKGELKLVRDCAGVKNSGSFDAFNFCYLEGTEKQVFDRWFELLNIKQRTGKELFGYSSWYNRYEDININSIEEDLEGCKKLLQKGDLFQIDDGWEPTVGDWLEPDPVKFPDGMKSISDKIHACGFKSGLWLAPFVATARSKIYQEHQDWFLKVNGDNWSDGSNWGGFYSLDLDNKSVRKYIEKTFDRVFNEWNFDLVKLDFLYAGAPFGDKRKSRAAKMIDAMKWLRELCGDKLIIGCGVPIMPAFGLVDYCRIGCDVGLDWNDKLYMRIIHRERVSTKQSISNTICRRQLNHRAWGNDPDVFFLRDENLSLTPEEKEYLFTVNALLSGILLTSDNFSKYDEKKIELIGKVRRLTKARVTEITDETITYKLDDETYTINRIQY